MRMKEEKRAVNREIGKLISNVDMYSSYRRQTYTENRHI